MTLFLAAAPVHVQQVETYEDGDVLDVAGLPRVIHAPGNSPGCVALNFEPRSLFFVGDVLFGYNVLRGAASARSRLLQLGRA